jgi:hypothetical protein
VVTGFVEHIDDAVDPLERLGRRHLPGSPLEKKVRRQKPCNARRLTALALNQGA